MKTLSRYLTEERKHYQIYPESKKVFEAFRSTPYNMTRLVIIGQDPYHNGTALGVAFGTEGSTFKFLNPSLQKIFEVLHYQDDIDKLSFPPMNDFTLSRWTDQGTLLLNRVLTVRKGKAGSHKNKGWETFTDAVINRLNQAPRKIVFMLWGKEAKLLAKKINQRKHLVLSAEHPAAAAYDERMWDSEDCFITANKFFVSLGEKEILW